MKKLLLLIFFANTIIAQEKINDSICSEVSFKEDKFNGEKSYNSPDIDRFGYKPACSTYHLHGFNDKTVRVNG